MPDKALFPMRKGSEKNTKKPKVIALAGNPNVGKSTLFNQLTGLHQHTGNWPGKTVSRATGVAEFGGTSYLFVDLPGTYSLFAHSGEEEVARDFICFGEPDAVLLVCDATCLSRNLNLVLQVLEMTDRVVVCVNLMDEAKKRHIKLDLALLSKRLGVPVVGCTAKKKKTLYAVLEALAQVADAPPSAAFKVRYSPPIEEAVSHVEKALPTLDLPISSRWLALRLLEGEKDLLRVAEYHFGHMGNKSKRVMEAVVEAQSRLRDGELEDGVPSALVRQAEAFVKEVETERGERSSDRLLDSLLTGRKTAFPLMLLFLLFVFWLTISGANLISDALSKCFFGFEGVLEYWLVSLSCPSWLVSALVEGVYRVLTWVVAVMLPPMLIFFPLFTLLEDVGYLPRIAYNLDKPFAMAGACGKQALTMCMGFGCNAVGVTGCRIIDSPRERRLAILTNTFVPCNGRFPLLITLLSLFFVGGGDNAFLSALLLLGLVALSVAMTLLVTKLLSVTYLKGLPSSFALELPPFRKPKVMQVLVRSLLDRTVFVLGRAVAVAIPAGVVIWLFANIPAGEGTVLSRVAAWLDPLGQLLGMDGMILLAFCLAFPANEIFLPVLLMGYLAKGSLVDLGQLAGLKTVLSDNGWTWQTALSVVLFSMFHFPCSTTLLTIKKETGSIKDTVLAFFLPTLCGVLCCLLVNFTVGLFA